MTSPLAGIEAGLRLTPIGRMRTPVFDLFARFDLAFVDGDRQGITLFGMRVLLDVL